MGKFEKFFEMSEAFFRLFRNASIAVIVLGIVPYIFDRFFELPLAKEEVFVSAVLAGLLACIFLLLELLSRTIKIQGSIAEQRILQKLDKVIEDIKEEDQDPTP